MVIFFTYKVENFLKLEFIMCNKKLKCEVGSAQVGYALKGDFLLLRETWKKDKSIFWHATCIIWIMGVSMQLLIFIA